MKKKARRELRLDDRRLVHKRYERERERERERGSMGSVGELRVRALEEYNVGKHADAAELFVAAAEAVGGCAAEGKNEATRDEEAGLRCNASACWLAAGDARESLRCAEAAVEAAPEWCKVHLRKAEAEAAVRDFAAAVESLQTCLSLCRVGDEKDDVVRACAMEKLEAARDAMRIMRELRDDGTNAAGGEKTDPEKGIRELEEAAEERERLPEAKACLELAAARIKAGDMIAGLEQLKEAFAHDATCWQAAFQAGSILWSFGCPALALQWYHRGLSSEPRFLQGHVMMFGLLRRLGYQADEVSESNLRNILAAVPAHLDLSLCLANCLLSVQGRLSDAADALRDALKGPLDGRPRPGTVLRDKPATPSDWFSQGMVEFYLAYVLMIQGFLGEPMALLLLVAEHAPPTVPYLVLTARCAKLIGEEPHFQSAVKALREKLDLAMDDISDDADANDDGYDAKQNENASVNGEEEKLNASPSRSVSRRALIAELLALHDLCALPQLNFLCDKLEVTHALRGCEFAPQSFAWPEQKRALTRAIEKEAHAGGEGGQRTDGDGNLWIVRPSFPVIDAGEKPCVARIEVGERIFQRAQESLLEQRKALPKCADILVQRYVSRPLLLGGRKFSVRLNVVMLRLVPDVLVYLSTCGDVYVSESEYYLVNAGATEGDVDRHLTTCSTRMRPSEQFHSMKAKQEPQYSFDDLESAFGKKQWDTMWSKTCDVAASVVTHLKETLTANSTETSAYAHGTLGIPSMFGIDIVYDEQHMPWVLRLRHKIPESLSLATKAETESLLNAWRLAERLLASEVSGGMSTTTPNGRGGGCCDGDNDGDSRLAALHDPNVLKQLKLHRLTMDDSSANTKGRRRTRG